ncbi:hypothetical protein [Botrimarina hoheduenensis]|uniref:Uncharacterized protein n=1 Tax=Botrimarina hoheduenensis TaxID=2528000 RepID=A0A5C5W914_9BACT|nr:hypothetical protein [Botrimarina hoheduenensis]TWT46519.1 hypothetical protein Pla111_16150 [Botrimarina hoheduenensis]
MLTIATSLFAHALPLAQAATGPRGYTWSWAIILPCVLLGLMVALRPAKRTYDVKKPKVD